MPEEPLNDILGPIRDRLQQEVEAEFRALAQRHDAALAAVRREVEAEAEQRWSALLDQARAEAQQAVEAAVAAARADARREFAAEHVVPTSAAPLLQAFREVDAAQSVSDTLAALVRAASSTAARAALFVANGPQVDEWVVAGVPSVHESARSTTADPEGIVGRALSERVAVGAYDGAAVAAPLLLDGVPVGVLYGERNDGDSNEWIGALEAIARYGAAHLGYLTALRTAQARQWIRRDDGAAVLPSPGATTQSATTSDDEETAAKRYARLLVSEIKLYNEPAVRAGREQRDLLRRLGPDIDRARRLFEERVPPAVARREQHFHDELVQTLAGGDPSLLG